MLCHSHTVCVALTSPHCHYLVHELVPLQGRSCVVFVHTLQGTCPVPPNASYNEWEVADWVTERRRQDAALRGRWDPREVKNTHLLPGGTAGWLLQGVRAQWCQIQWTFKRSGNSDSDVQCSSFSAIATNSTGEEKCTMHAQTGSGFHSFPEAIRGPSWFTGKGVNQKDARFSVKTVVELSCPKPSCWCWREGRGPTRGRQDLWGSCCQSHSWLGCGLLCSPWYCSNRAALGFVYGHQSGVFSVIVSLHSTDIKHQLLWKV